MNKIKLTIVCCTDNKLVFAFATLVASFLKFYQSNELEFYLLHSELSPENDTKLTRFISHNAIKLTKILVPDNDFRNFPKSERFPKSIFYRLNIPNLLPETARVLYLDIDMIIDGRIDELWGLDLSMHSCAVVLDAASTSHKHMKAFGVEHYFNSGMMLINVERVRQQQLFQAAINFIKRNAGILRFPDQDALNYSLADSVIYVSERFNYLPSTRRNRFLRIRTKLFPKSRPLIYHFATRKKPWMYGCRHPMRRRWLEYLKYTPWSGMSPWGRTPKAILEKWTPKLFRRKAGR